MGHKGGVKRGRQGVCQRRVSGVAAARVKEELEHGIGSGWVEEQMRWGEGLACGARRGEQRKRRRKAGRGGADVCGTHLLRIHTVPL